MMKTTRTPMALKVNNRPGNNTDDCKNNYFLGNGNRDLTSVPSNKCPITFSFLLEETAVFMIRVCP